MGLGAFKIMANGIDITSMLRPLFINLTLTDEAGKKADSFSLTLFDDGKIAFPKTQADLNISTGDSIDRLIDRGTFTVNSVVLSSPANTLILSGDSANLAGEFKTQRDFTWENVSLKELIDAVASRSGYQPAVSDHFSNLMIEHRLQTGQSDADLLTELANENNATMKITRGKLVFFDKGDNKTVSGKILPAVLIHLTDEVKATITLAGTVRFQAVIAKYRDMDDAETRTVRIGDEKGKVKILSTIYLDEPTAKAVASSALHYVQRGEYILEIDDLPFISDLSAERKILISGHMRSQFNSEWMCESVTETLDENGHVQSARFVVPKQKVGSIPSLIHGSQ